MWWYDREALARVTPREATDDANTAASQLPACNPLVRGACPGVVGRIFEHGRQLWEQEPVWEAELLVPLKGVGEGDARAFFQKMVWHFFKKWCGHLPHCQPERPPDP